MQENEILSVTDITLSIKKNLETQFFQVSVQGEISNCKEQTSGHFYFTLKDASAQISAVLFRSNARDLKTPPKNGDHVVVQATLSVYPPRGNYQLIVKQLQHVGVGALLIQLHELKNKLESLGWFDRSKKKRLPENPKIIGIVTSPTGAVIQDIINILSRRRVGFHLILNPVKVQGDGAATEIAAAIDLFNKHTMADVLIVGRGGGSLEDLWPFNEEIVAAAIHRSNIPIISAVGHETDFSIADFVADVRAPTPSAAAEIVMGATENQLQYFHQINKRLDQTVSHFLNSYKQRFNAIRKHPLLSSPLATLNIANQKLDDIAEKIAWAIKQELSTKTLKIEGIQRALYSFNPKIKIEQYKQKLKQLAAHLRSIDPKSLLKKGYALLFQEKSASVILSTKDVKAGDNIHIMVQDGSIKAQIYEV
jgi:exodeoxyribonuclease VII large subunit